MPILAYGINHRSAPISVREKLSFGLTDLPGTLQKLTQEPAVNEAVILSTCHRTEIYTDAANPDILQQWLIKEKALPINLQPYCYTHYDENAVRHVMRVASGLDSMILGEPQVLGQIKQAYQVACDAGTVGMQLKHLFPAVFAASKHIRTHSHIGAHGISIAYAILQCAKHIYNQLTRCRVLLIGAGETIALVATHLYQSGVKQIVIANRTVDNVNLIAASTQAHVISMQDIPIYLKESDIVISATSSPLPILGKGMIETALKQKKRRLLFLVDLAVPRDIEPEVAALENVYLYHLDDLQKIIAENLKNKKMAAQQAEAMVDAKTTRFLQHMRFLSMQTVITDYRKKIETTCDVELQKALWQLQQGADAETVIKQFSHQLINKIMHHPTQQLRKAAENAQYDMITWAKKLFE